MNSAGLGTLIRSLLLVNLVLLGTACAILSRPYIEPQTGQLAELTLENNTANVAYAQIYREATRCTGRSFVKPPIPLGSSRTIKIDASSDFAFAFYWYHKPSYASEQLCGPLLSFSPHPNNTYVARLANAEEPGKCTFNLYKLTREGSSVIAEPVEYHLRLGSVPFDENGSFCLPIAK